MGQVQFDITMSLDGFIAGPNPSLEQPLGEGGEHLHEWLFGLANFRERHGLTGGETNTAAEIHEEAFQATGAVVMGRRMFTGGEGPWEDDPNADGWWGDDPPFHVPVLVLSHHPRETVTKQGGTSFTFVTDGIESALSQAKDAAGEKDVAIGGGANTIQQFLEVGLVDELQIHIAPLLLGGGTRLFDGVKDIELEGTRVVESPDATHLRFRVMK